MTTCHYSDILQLVATLAGLDYSYEVGASGLAVDEERRIRASVNAHLAQLWPKGKWPGVARIEQRAFRATYASATAYTSGTFVYWPQEDGYYQAIRSTTGNDPTDANGVLDSAHWALARPSFSGNDYSAATAYVAGDIVFYVVNGNFYQCHTASTGNAPTNASFFGLLVPFEPYVSFTQSGQTAIDDQAEIILWTSNPRLTTKATVIDSMLTENGITPTGVCPARPWVEFKLVCPVLRGELYDAADAYAVGDQVQFAIASGNVETIDFYDCTSTASAGDTPASDPDKWTRVEIPDYFKSYLAGKGALLFLLGDSDPRYASASQIANDAEQNLTDTLYRVQKQLPRSQYRTYDVAA